MDVAASELRRAGWNRVVRTAEREAGDYEVGDGRKTARVEVKGTTAPIRRIDLTRNERDTGMRYPHSILFLVSQIELDADGPRANGGHARLMDPWTPAEDDMTARTLQLPSA